MNILIVYAHPEPGSFNGAMKDLAVETLVAAGHDVVVSDLYAMDFNPVAGRGDIMGEPKDPDFFSLAAEQTAAVETGRTAPDIVAEMEKLKRADFVILQFPVWWFGMPAMLKGWADRVFARGFAYLPGRKYDTGMFKGKLAMVAATTGTSADTYAPDGIDGDILTVLWPVHNGLLRYSGFDVLPPFVGEARAALLVLASLWSSLLAWRITGLYAEGFGRRAAALSAFCAAMAPANAAWLLLFWIW